MPVQDCSFRQMFSSILMVVAVWQIGVRPALAAERSDVEPVEVVRSDGGWQLLRGGSPYFIRGAGGDGSKETFARCGGNSIRTWGADDLDASLDEAHRLGLTVAVGIWLGHERHGFDYTDLDQVAEQHEAARQVILRYRDHPAVLLWGIGNEMEGFGDGDNAAIWSAVNNIAAMAKKLDPNHPTMTVIAEIGGRKVEAIERLCPAVDIVGINSYGGVTSIAERYREVGGKKPYVVTEFGPPGAWEVGRNSFDAVEEPISTRKGTIYRRAYEALSADRELCLGCYAFLWGNKQEATATWFGMLLPDGSRLEAVDAMTEAWSGSAPANRCPQIEAMRVVGPSEVDPGAAVQVEIEISDPEKDSLSVEWVLNRDAGQYITGGDASPKPPSYAESIITTDAEHAELRMPSGGGRYRLFVYVRDRQGGAATANVPLRVTGPESLMPSMKASLPLVVYGDDASGSPYVPSGWMGDTGAIDLDEKCRDDPRSGTVCLEVQFQQPGGWGGVIWQSPADDWGDLPGGCDLSGAKRLSFWARGKKGGEKVTFAFGNLGRDRKYYDTAKGELTEVELTAQWQQFTIDVADKDLQRIKSGFSWVVAGQGKPLTFYLDDIRYE